MEVKNKIIVFVIIIYLLHHVSIFSDSFFSVSRCQTTGGTKDFCTMYQESLVGLNVLIHTTDCSDGSYLGVASPLWAVLILPQPTAPN